MKTYRYVVLGAGPSGLSIAHALVDGGCKRSDILVIEKEAVAGGLCRSEIVDGTPLDIGGGHFLDVKRKPVLEFLFRFLPRDEWAMFDRVSKIRIRGTEVDHPLEANLWQFSIDAQADYLESIAQAGCIRGDVAPVSFAAWIRWKFGEQIAEEYMLPYNRKIWCMDPDELGTYWLYKLPNVSFRETLLSCLEGKANGALPAHGNFFYPKKFGYGEVWRRMGDALGDALVTSCPVNKIDLVTRTINDRWQAETIISTIPWTSWTQCCDLPDPIKSEIAKFKNASIDIDYHPETINSPAHWIYEPDESISYHRLLLRSNFVPDGRGYWTETNSVRSGSYAGTRFHNEYAYPVNTLGKPEAVEKVLAWARGQGVIGIGRWGRWEHMNSDVAVEEAIEAAKRLTKGEGA